MFPISTRLCHVGWRDRFGIGSLPSISIEFFRRSVHFCLNCQSPRAWLTVSSPSFVLPRRKCDPNRGRTESLLLALPTPATSLPREPRRAGSRTEFQSECVDFFAEVVQVFGVPKSVGEIYGLLYASPEPLSFSDIVERLKISKGSASQGLQLLRSLAAIKRVSASHGAEVGGGNHAEGGTARGYYEPELSLRTLLSAVLRERVTPLTAAGASRMKRLRELAALDGEGSDFLQERVEQLESWRRRLRTVLPVLTTLLGPNSRK